VSDHGLLIAGGAAGIAAAFNTPLGGIMFAIEELSRSPEQRSNGLIMAAIVVGGLMSVSIYGNTSYFGVVRAIRVDRLDLHMLWPGLLVAVVLSVRRIARCGRFARWPTARRRLAWCFGGRGFGGGRLPGLIIGLGGRQRFGDDGFRLFGSRCRRRAFCKICAWLRA